MHTQIRCRGALVALLALGWLMGGTLSASAADKPAHADKAHADKAGHGPEKSPMSFFDIHRYDLGIYTLIVFGLLFAILSTFAWKPIQEGLQKREDVIRQARDEALQARDEAQKIRDQLQQELAKANETVRGMIDEARKDGQKLIADLKAKATAEIEADKARQLNEIATARDQALQELYQQSVQLATVLAGKALQRQISLDDHHRLIDDALVELKRNNPFGGVQV
jgi:F-type H+-transporting ATPase subunit b